MIRRAEQGFTLIEVMVALLIVALGLSALIVTAVRVLGDSYSFRERTMALYVGLNVVTELRLAGELPDLRENSDEIEFADANWRFTTRVSETEVDSMRRVEVDVALADDPDQVIRSVLGFVGDRVPSDAANGLWINQNAGGSNDGDDARNDGGTDGDAGAGERP